MNTSRASTLRRSLVVGFVVGLTVSSASLAIEGWSASAQAADSSAQTVRAADYSLAQSGHPMPNLEVTVSQTEGLVGQGILVSWTGAESPSVRPQSTIGGENFLQIFQCWGEDPNNPGHPDRTTCQYGGFATAAATRDGALSPLYTVPSQDTDYVVPAAGFFNPPYGSIPFVSSPNGPVPNVTVSSIATTNGVRSKIPGVDVNNNQFFTKYTTNEVPWVGSDSAGTGSVKFEVQTVSTSPGLGCGARMTAGANVSGQSCWLVVLPRGESDNGESGISTSGLFWDSWEHHVAVRLDFKPVGVTCAIGAAEKQLAGSELVSQAVASWQPQFCAKPDAAALVLSTGDESDALAAASRTSPNPLALTSRPKADSASDVNVYAPLAISGVAISVAIDRRVKPIEGVPTEFALREGTAFETIKLTPRLLAKLMTASYLSALPSGADLSHVGYVSAIEPGPNAYNLIVDNDFLNVNCGGLDEATLRSCEWYWQDISGVGVSDVLMPAGRSDLAWTLWNYIMADPDARAFLNGTPDPWGMKVNPWYSTNPEVNPSGSAMEYPRTNFPKADPAEKPDTTESNPSNGTGPINLVTWRPFTSDFESGAYYTLRGDALLLGEWQRTSTPPKWTKATRALVGDQRVLAVTTTAAAAKYQTATAQLLNPAGAFVAPTSSALAAGAAAMTPTQNLSVLSFDPASAKAKAAPSAYPLSMPVYAAMNPLQTDAVLRAIYASFIRFVVQDGQTPGTSPGQLPAGYAPLSPGLVTQAMQVANSIQAGIRPQLATDLGSIPAASYGSTGLSYVSSSSTGDVTSIDAQGEAAGALSAGATPEDPFVGPVASAVPLGLGSGLAAAAAVPLFARVRRRSPF